MSDLHELSKMSSFNRGQVIFEEKLPLRAQLDKKTLTLSWPKLREENQNKM